MSILSIYSGFIDSTISSFLLGIGFICMGFSSLRLVPADLFNRKVSFTVPPKNEYRKLDVIIQTIGFVFMVSGLIVSRIYT